MNQITYDANNQLSSHGHPKKRQVTSALPRLPDRLPGDPVRGWDVMVKTSISGWVYEITFRRISKWGRFLYGWCLLFLFIFDERSYHPAERVLIFVIWMCLKFINLMYIPKQPFWWEHDATRMGISSVFVHLDIFSHGTGYPLNGSHLGSQACLEPWKPWPSFRW